MDQKQLAEALEKLLKHCDALEIKKVNGQIVIVEIKRKVAEKINL